MTMGEFLNTAPPHSAKSAKRPLLSLLSLTPGALFEKMHLRSVNPRAYTFSVSETTDARFDSLNHVSAQPRRAAFLCVSPQCASFYGRALVGKPSGLPGAYVTGLSTLPCARSPHLTVGRGLNTHVRGRNMRHIPARPEQSNIRIQIINRALHDASLASTPNAAIDLLADALLALAALAHPMEGRSHG